MNSTQSLIKNPGTFCLIVKNRLLAVCVGQFLLNIFRVVKNEIEKLHTKWLHLIWVNRILLVFDKIGIKEQFWSAYLDTMVYP